MDELIRKQAAIDALDVLCQEHRYKIPGKVETYSQYNEAWQDALDRAEGAIGNLPSIQPKHGKWIDMPYVPSHTKYMCSECGKTIYTNSDYIKEHKFCFSCGAKMER